MSITRTLKTIFYTVLFCVIVVNCQPVKKSFIEGEVVLIEQHDCYGIIQKQFTEDSFFVEYPIYPHLVGACPDSSKYCYLATDDNGNPISVGVWMNSTGLQKYAE